jgi:hypothetical protein
MSPESLLAVLVELDRVRGLVLQQLEQHTERLLPPPSESDDDAQRALHELLLTARRAVLGHPTAARAVRDLLIAQGRRYAETPDGTALRDALVSSEAVATLRRVWETVSLGAVDGPATAAGVPDAWAELLVDVIAGNALDETVTARLRSAGPR